MMKLLLFYWFNMTICFDLKTSVCMKKCKKGKKCTLRELNHVSFYLLWLVLYKKRSLHIIIEELQQMIKIFDSVFSISMTYCHTKVKSKSKLLVCFFGTFIWLKIIEHQIDVYDFQKGWILIEKINNSWKV